MMTILLAGTSPAIQRLSKILKSRRPRAHIIRAMDGAEAFNAIVVYQHFDGLIMDNQMDVSHCPSYMQKETKQGKNAGIFLTEITRGFINAHAPIVLVSGDKMDRPGGSKCEIVHSSESEREAVKIIVKSIENWVKIKTATKKIKPACSVGLVYTEPDIAELVEMVLDEMNIEVIKYGEPVRALLKMKDRRPDLLYVMNMMLPEINVIDFLRKVKRQWPDKVMKTLLFSSRGWVPLEMELLRDGLIDEVIIKPFDLNDLKDITRALIDKVSIEKAGNQKPGLLRSSARAKSSPNNGFDPARYTVGLVWRTDELAELVKILLKAKGYQIIDYHTTEQALAKMSTRRPDLLLLCNLVLPGLLGVDLIKIVREHWNNNDVEIIVLSVGGAGEQTIMNMIGGYLQKPFDPFELAGLVEHVLKKREERQAVK